jgi:hypothetical protein
MNRIASLFEGMDGCERKRDRNSWEKWSSGKAANKTTHTRGNNGTREKESHDMNG